MHGGDDAGGLLGMPENKSFNRGRRYERVIAESYQYPAEMVVQSIPPDPNGRGHITVFFPVHNHSRQGLLCCPGNILTIFGYYHYNVTNTATPECGEAAGYHG
jgi:hypothetical protein